MLLPLLLFCVTQDLRDNAVEGYTFRIVHPNISEALTLAHAETDTETEDAVDRVCTPHVTVDAVDTVESMVVYE